MTNNNQPPRGAITPDEEFQANLLATSMGITIGDDASLIMWSLPILIKLTDRIETLEAEMKSLRSLKEGEQNQKFPPFKI